MSAILLSRMRSIICSLTHQRSCPKTECRAYRAYLACWSGPASRAIRPLPVILILILLACFAVQPSSCSTTATVKITATILPAVELSRPTITWDLNPKGPGAFTRTESVLVKANTDWQLSVEDPNPGTSGHLAEWTGTGYGPTRLNIPVRIASSNMAPRSIIAAAKPLETGSHTGAEGKLVKIVLTQVVTPGECPLPNGHHYRIVINLKAVPVTKH
jgi:hypothetical protein